jgi:ABC-2 type transport system permease protein
MTAATLDRRSATLSGELTGTWTLVRFNLRRDRRRILIWTLSIAAMYAYCATAFAALFADPVEQAGRASIMRSPASVLMSGPGFGLDDYWFGAIMANELLLWLAGALALMSILLVVRYTRAEEESSRSELIRSSVVGRHAPAVAAYVTVVIVNALIAVVSFPILLSGAEGDVAGSAAYVVGVALVALAFGAVATVTAQVTEHARGANGMAIGVLMAAVFVRGVGDMPRIGGTPLSWFSPIAWAQQTRVFVDLRWWPLLLPVVFVVVMHVLAATLGNRRDFGAGLVASKAGRADATPSLRTPFALAWRQQRTAFWWWMLGVGLAFLAIGTYLVDVGDLFADLVAENPTIAQIFGEDDMTGSFVRIMMLFGALCAAGFGISGIGRARAEETDNRTEALLATPVSRARWMTAAYGVPVLGGTALLAVAGVGLWIGAVSAGFEGPGFGSFLLSAVAYLPSLLVVLGLSAALFAWAPKLMGLAWIPVVWGVIDGMFGDVIDAPSWLRDLNPFRHAPNAIASAPQDWQPLVWLTALAVVLFVAAFVGFRRRDVPTV